uniref:Uncharacterized protein n=1 Tax=Candidatus Methanogaster sp. ANME-2c ERB4 TaxID=2759911 RepID=A0A7G9YRE7_9EURY|nr:hypothetical protein EGELPFMD_00001 [Methanosarcinales archaeon ANME-2c ERB4]
MAVAVLRLFFGCSEVEMDSTEFSNVWESIKTNPTRRAVFDKTFVKSFLENYGVRRPVVEFETF